MEKKGQKGISFLKESEGQKTFGFHKEIRTVNTEFCFFGKKSTAGSFAQK